MSEHPQPLSPRPRVIVAIVAMSCESMVVDCVAAILSSEEKPQTIVIVENGGAQAFDRLVAALAGAGLTRDDAFDSREGQRRERNVSAKPGETRLLLIDPGDNLGYAGGNNLALLRLPPHEWDAAWILNPDTIPQDGALSALIDCQRAGGYGMVGSRLLFAESGLVQTWGGLSWNLWLGRGRYIGYLRSGDETPATDDVLRRTTFVSGASMFVTRRYCDDVGLMDDSFFMYGEDVDWCLRRGAYRLGYAHDSVVRHIHGGTAGSSRLRKSRSRFSIYFGERNKVLLGRKHLGRAAPLGFALYLIGTVEYLARSRSWPQFVTALKGWLAGVRGETGFRRV